MITKISLAFFCAFLNAHLFADDIIRGEDHFEFRYRASIPILTSPARIWLPLAESNSFQDVTVKKISAPVRSQKMQDPNYRNEILWMELGRGESGKVIAIDYQVTRREKSAYSLSGDVGRFLKPERLVPITAQFKALAEEATRGKTDDLARGRALYDYVLAHMKYDKVGTGWGRGDAVHACDAHAGNCTDFHSYFIALARSIGIPARFAIGFAIPANENSGVVSGYHCWAEFAADGKWIPVDISEAWKTPALADYYFGHHPANRFEISRGRDLETSVLPPTGPFNFLVYPYLETSGANAKIEAEFSFTRISTAANRTLPPDKTSNTTQVINSK